MNFIPTRTCLHAYIHTYMHTYKLSVIVPVYNVADYLKRGIGSILSQSYKDYELILVDDGSTDDSGRICDEYASIDERVKIVHQDNCGVSSARNAGLEIAQGEWVYFMDSDDELMEDALLTLMNGISADVDVVMGGYEEIDMDGKILNPTTGRDGIMLSKNESLRQLFHPYESDFGYVGHSWLRLYRMDVINNHQVRFDSSVSFCEGTLFNANYLCVSRGTTYHVRKPISRYYHREHSAVRSTYYGVTKAYLTSFDSLVKVLRSIKEIYPANSEIVRCAKEEVMLRYHRIKGKMVDFDAMDEQMLKSMRRKCVDELGMPFLLGYLFRWGKKKMRKKLFKTV